jgi:Iap family predicted aminopeptidase
MHRRRAILLVALVMLTLALLLPAAASASGMLTYDQAIDYLYAKGYPNNIETYLDNLGTSPLGYRLAGTPADNEAAYYLSDKLSAMGLSVTMERVPVDVWDVRGASVTVGANEFECSQFAGVPGTDADGITADVVYVGSGLAADYIGVDVKGKIVVVDSSMDNFWFNLQGDEATRNGAKAVILTSNASDPDAEYPSAPWYVVAPDALGANDGEYDMKFAPLIYLSQQDGDWLKAEIADAAATQSSVRATFKSDVVITLADDGGYGWNVLAKLRGTAHNGQKVVINAHHDAHFRAGLDDTGAVAETMAMAKAMTMSGYRPKRDIVFLFDTAEEFGFTNSWYDWSIGAWTFITQQHPGWVGKIAAFWSVELMAAEDATLDFNTAPELAAWIDGNAGRMADAYLSNGYTLETPQSTWQNGWSLQASGVPSFEVSAGGPGFDDRYHSTYEVQDQLDWDYMADINKFFFRLFRSMDGAVLPYDFEARGRDFSETLNVDDLTAAGVTAKDAERITDLAASLEMQGLSWNASKGSLRAADRKRADLALLQAAEESLVAYTALDAWDVNSYPHQQTLWDIQSMDAALAALTADPVDPAAAAEAVTAVGANLLGTVFSPSVYLYDLTRHDPDYYRVTWGALGKQVDQFDMSPVLAKIAAGDYAGAAAKVQKMRDADALSLRMRVNRLMSATALLGGDLTYLNRLARH